MFISKISLGDFRVYYGHQELSFIKNTKKNVFIISGNNGFGKTTLLNSLVWCLYGKLMVDVDDKFRKEIYEAGGYRKFASNNLNKKAASKGKTNYDVSVTISDIFIPSFPCKEVTIARSFDLMKGEDDVQILIDGVENELTREVGQEIFISDFILPKEIAKFFFFDAEKIVFLAEMKSIEDKRSLSKAYSEVLGIKKYEDLKSNLEDLRIRFKRNSASEKDKHKFDELQKEVFDAKEMIAEYENQIARLQEEKLSRKQTAEHYQEKLIREGNSMTIAELNDLKKLKLKLNEESEQIKLKLKELLDVVPFAIAGSNLSKVRDHALSETEHAQKLVSPELLRRKIKKVQKDIASAVEKLDVTNAITRKVSAAIEESLFKHFNETAHGEKFKILLEFTDSEKNQFEAIYNNLKYSFSESFRNLLTTHKSNKITYNKVIRKLSNAEAKEDDLLVQEIRNQKTTADKRIEEIDKELMVLSQEIGGLHKEINSKSKVVSQLSKKINLELSDQVKDETAQRLISELDDFIKKLKLEKKVALESRIKKDINSLMHKRNFISRVEVEIATDLIDIHLFDQDGGNISKENLSKGEQQLYATALLKSLVDESMIKFPVFIDSPLQKFDKNHAKNIICDFYPKISEQVVLFPLLEKELTEKEYEMLLPKINKAFLINYEGNYHSTFREVDSHLFSEYKNIYENVH